MHDRIGKTRYHRDGSGNPALIGERSVTGEARHAASRQPADGNDDQRAPQQPIHVDRVPHGQEDLKTAQDFLAKTCLSKIKRETRYSPRAPVRL